MMIRQSVLNCALLFVAAGVAVVCPTEASGAEAETGNRSLETVTVFGSATFPGSDTALEDIAANIDSIDSATLRKHYSLDATEYLTRNIGGIVSSDAQGNPLQRDIHLRGFVASPLLGLSQGLSVYQDGVRINEPFGDTVNWSTLPENAIARLDVIRGSNPLFGLNTLGGALNLRMKSGFTDADTDVAATAGSFGRYLFDASTGGRFDEQTAFFLAGSHFDERGWRDFSPSRSTNLFGDLRHRFAYGEANVSITYANASLIGNGPLPDSLLTVDRSSIFTRPDLTEHRMLLVSLGGVYQPTDYSKINVVAYQRRSDIDTLNGDDSDFEACDVPALVCEPDSDEPALDRFENPIGATANTIGATLNRSGTRQLGRGIAAQWNKTGLLFGKRSNFILGVNFDTSETDFRSDTELGTLDDTRRGVGSGAFVADADVLLRASTRHRSAYFTEVAEISPRFSATFAGRYDRQTIALRDRLGTDLDGDHAFSRFNPSISLTMNIGESATAYASIARASRSPSPVELTCADADAPCRLPNAFLSDPPLRQVVATDREIGIRGTWNGAHRSHLAWRADVFRTINRDDIVFVSAGELTNQGYFTNVSATRRQGFEFNLEGRREGLGWFVNYLWLDATFEDDLQLASAHHPEAVDGEIPVRRGDRLPNLLKHLLKAGLSYDLTSRLAFAADATYASSQFARGDEANLLEPLSGYVVANAQLAYRQSDTLALIASAQNIFDRRYATFATLGDADDVLGTADGDQRFSTPAAPRGAWLTIQLRW